MQATGKRDTRVEVALRCALHAAGLRYRLDSRPVPSVPRRADIVFPGVRLAVFVDGCFWHGCPDHMTWPAANAAWWQRKIRTTRARDIDTTRRLTAAGWTVVRLWEHENVPAAALRIAAQVSTLRQSPSKERAELA